MKWIFTTLVSFVLLMFSITGSAASFNPILNIVPSTTALSILGVDSTTVNYTVTNNASRPVADISINQNYQMPSGVLITGVQANTCTGTLSPGAQCTFTVSLQGTNTKRQLTLEPQLCMFHNAICSVPTITNRVAITARGRVVTIASSSGSNGSVSPSGSNRYDYGSNVTFTAMPNANFGVDQWTVDGTVVQTGGNTYTLNNVTADHVVTVDFLPPAVITATSGTPQSVLVGTVFPAPLVATVTNSSGNPVPNITVTFTANGSAGGASGTFTGGSSTATAITNSNGVATSPAFTANTIAGGYTVSGTVSGLSTPASFSLTNTAGGAASIAATSGQSQSTTVSQPFPTDLVATVYDANGNRVAGATVTFTAPTSGASGTFSNGTTTIIKTTDSRGHADASFTANSTVSPTGVDYVVNATVPGAPTPAAFDLNNTAGTPTTIAISSGTPQSAQVTAQFSSKLVALVTDAGGHPVQDVKVTFTASPSSGGASGTFSTGGASVVVKTDINGLATSPFFTANSVAGAYNVSAKASGVAASVEFALTNTAGPATAIAISSGNTQSAQISTPFIYPLVALVTDAHGNVVSGVPVTFTPVPATNGASGTFTGGTPATVSTASTGLSTSPTFTANSIAASYTVRASIPGGASVSFDLTNTTGTPTTVSVSSGSPQTKPINTGFAPLVALVTDAGGNPVAAGTTVTFTAIPNSSTGASGTFPGSAVTATAQTVGTSGLATAPPFTSNSMLGAYTVTASVVGAASPASFALTNTVGPVRSITVSAGNGQTEQTGSPFTGALVALVTDAGGNPVSGQTVTFMAPTSGASVTPTSITETTAADGKATVPGSTFTANSITGDYVVNATVPGATNNPAQFNLSNTVDVPNSIAVISGSPQSEPINTLFPTAMIAKVTDSSSNPVSGAQVMFTVIPNANGASVTPTSITEVTGSNGEATVPANTFTSNTKLGTYSLEATVSHVASPADFSLTNTVGPANSITVFSGSGQSAQYSTAFKNPLVALVTDAGGNPINGASVTFTPPASGQSGTFTGGTPATVTTNAQGLAQAPTFTANATLGVYNVAATVPGVTNPANFGLTNIAGPASLITVVSGSGQSAIVSTPFTNQLVAHVTDAAGHPINAPNIVTFTINSNNGASGTFPGIGTKETIGTDANGNAGSSFVVANTVVGSYTVTAQLTTAPATVNFNLTNTAAISSQSSLMFVKNNPDQTGSAGTGSLVIYNKTSQPITNLQVIIPPPPNGNITVTNDTCTPLAANGNCIINFDSSDVTTDSTGNTSVQISDPGTTNTLTIPVSALSVTPMSPPLNPSAHPNISFLLVNSCPNPEILLVSNNSSNTINNINPTPTGLSNITTTNYCSGISLASNENCMIEVNSSPTASGTGSITVSSTNTIPGNSSPDVDISTEVEPQNITPYQPTSIDGYPIFSKYVPGSGNCNIVKTVSVPDLNQSVWAADSFYITHAVPFPGTSTPGAIDTNNGQANTVSIAYTQQVAGIPNSLTAAGACLTFTDTRTTPNNWYLPSICELGGNPGTPNPACTNTDNILSASIGIINAPIWSSSEWQSDPRDAWGVALSNLLLSQLPALKGDTAYSYCARAYTN